MLKPILITEALFRPINILLSLWNLWNMEPHYENAIVKIRVIVGEDILKIF